jgi:hypothetical protein|nr:MAG TPA: hypothetical protein [Caudoviricetes sp.]
MKLEIKRTELKKIWEISCKDWKPKLAKYAQKDPFSETIKFTEKQINEMIKAYTAEQLPVVKEIFDVRDSWGDIKSFEDVIKYLGEEDEDVIEYKKLIKANITSKSLSFQMLICWVKSLNERHVLDWSDSYEYKYYIWWYMNPFRVSSVDYSYECSYVPSALCFKNRKIAIYAYQNKEFFNLYENYMK